MASFPDKVSVKTELSEKRSHFDLSCMHLTTSDFMEFCPAYVRDNIPKESFSLKSDVFARLAPLYTPLLGKAKLVQRAYFVPFRTICPQWNDFITKVPHVDTSGTQYNVIETPYFRTSDFQNLLLDSAVSTAITSGVPDFTLSGTDYLLTRFGRYIFKVFHALGYKIPIGSNGLSHWSAMRLLAFAKVYYDWFTDGHYVGTYLDYTNVAQLFNRDASSAYIVTASDMLDIFHMSYHVNYEPDYFVSSFDSPVGPGYANQMPPLTIDDITNNSSNRVQRVTNRDNLVGTPNQNVKPTNGTPFIGSTGAAASSNSAYSVLTQYIIHALHLANDYCMRFNMVGAKSIDRYLARFGSLLTAEKLRRSVFLGKHETPLQFGAIYSTADTVASGTGDYLGSYSGTGIVDSDGTKRFDIDFQSDEFGVYMVVYTILPRIMYMQGFDRNILHQSVEDYFNGQFDSLGNQAIASGELYTSMVDTDTYSNQFDAVLSWTPQKSEYKRSYDFVSGEFSLPSMASLSDYWHLGRIFDASYWSSQGLGAVAKTPVFINGSDAFQYDRIFQYGASASSHDHFNVIFQFAVSVNAPALPLYETYEFEGDGKTISVKVDGSQP